jgi:hypothetical protein
MFMFPSLLTVETMVHCDVAMKSIICRGVTLHGIMEYNASIFGLKMKPRSACVCFANLCLAYFSFLKVEIVHSCEVSARFYQAVWNIIVVLFVVSGNPGNIDMFTS